MMRKILPAILGILTLAAAGCGSSPKGESVMTANGDAAPRERLAEGHRREAAQRKQQSDARRTASIGRLWKDDVFLGPVTDVRASGGLVRIEIPVDNENAMSICSGTLSSRTWVERVQVRDGDGSLMATGSAGGGCRQVRKTSAQKVRPDVEPESFLRFLADSDPKTPWDDIIATVRYGQEEPALIVSLFFIGDSHWAIVACNAARAWMERTSGAPDRAVVQWAKPDGRIQALAACRPGQNVADLR